VQSYDLALLIRCTYRAVDAEVIYVRKQVGCIHSAGTDGRRGSIDLESSGAAIPFLGSFAFRFWGLFLQAHSRVHFFSFSRDSVSVLLILINHFLLKPDRFLGLATKKLEFHNA
jgi:hypothetical protein